LLNGLFDTRKKFDISLTPPAPNIEDGFPTLLQRIRPPTPPDSFWHLASNNGRMSAVPITSPQLFLPMRGWMFPKQHPAASYWRGPLDPSLSGPTQHSMAPSTGFGV
jgi:hypothetical protein